MFALRWSHAEITPPMPYRCGHCDHIVSSVIGLLSDLPRYQVAICSNCSQPTYFANNVQVPGPLFGNPVGHVPADVASAYDEARRCMTVSAYTSAVLLCRKLLMHIAAAQGADPGKPFAFYVDYLAANHYIPPNGKAWVDHIRAKGNEATHELPAMDRADAEQLITFLEMLLRFIYEFHARIAPPPPPAPPAP